MEDTGITLNVGLVQPRKVGRHKKLCNCLSITRAEVLPPFRIMRQPSHYNYTKMGVNLAYSINARVHCDVTLFTLINSPKEKEGKGKSDKKTDLILDYLLMYKSALLSCMWRLAHKLSSKVTRWPL